MRRESESGSKGSVLLWLHEACLARCVVLHHGVIFSMASGTTVAEYDRMYKFTVAFRQHKHSLMLRPYSALALLQPLPCKGEVDVSWPEGSGVADVVLSSFAEDIINALQDTTCLNAVGFRGTDMWLFLHAHQCKHVIEVSAQLCEGPVEASSRLRSSLSSSFKPLPDVFAESSGVSARVRYLSSSHRRTFGVNQHVYCRSLCAKYTGRKNTK
eukprot:1222320-Amphidinium_carterae.1